MESKTRATRRQFSILLEFMERHGKLFKSHLGHRSVIVDRLWRKLANTLNSCDSVKKTPDKWKKVWVDWKSNTKKKASIIQQCQDASVAEDRAIPVLTKEETRLLKLIGVLVEDHLQIRVQRSQQSTATLHQNANDSEMENFVENDNKPVASPQASNSRLSPAALSPKSETSPSNQRVDQSERQGQTTDPIKHPSPPRQYQRVRQSEMSIEHRRLRVDEMRERNETRRLELDAERNTVLNRIADIAQAFLDQYMYNNMPINGQHGNDSE